MPGQASTEPCAGGALQAAAWTSELAPFAEATQVLMQWRHESASATLRFLDALLATVPAPRTG